MTVKAPTQSQLDAAFAAARSLINQTGYGGWVSDDACRQLSDGVASAVVSADTTAAARGAPSKQENE